MLNNNNNNNNTSNNANISNTNIANHQEEAAANGEAFETPRIDQL